METCPFCDKQFKFSAGPDFTHVDCDICGNYKVERSVVSKLRGTELSARQKANIIGSLRENPNFEITRGNIDSLFHTRTPSFHEKADKLLLRMESITEYAGQLLKKEPIWMHWAWCLNNSELNEIIRFMMSPVKRIQARKSLQDNSTVYRIDSEGWRHLEELKRINADSNQCFVAMWFDDEIKDVYDKAIKPAIEYTEDDASEPRFRAVKIDTEEHINDINDEIIAQIRRSRFMVCDLTGYRGGVYFEAGFAYGLGLDVIYTCRKDWTAPEDLADDNGETVKHLNDSTGKPIRVKKEGVHFDLAHRNRIQWEDGDEGLAEFRKNLENRIKAVIV